MKHLSILISLLALLCSAAGQDQRPTPSDGDLREARSRVDKVYGEQIEGAKTREAKIALAKKLENVAKDPETQLAIQFVLLEEALALAIDAPGHACLLEIVRARVERFEGNLLALSLHSLKAAARTKQSSEVRQTGVERAFELGLMLSRALEIEQAAEAYKLAKRESKKLESSELEDLAKSRIKDMNQAKVLVKDHSAIVSRLDAKADDPAANEAYGLVLCVLQDDWGLGLEHLAKGENLALAAIAKRDLSLSGTEPSESETELLGLADDWWNAAAGTSWSELVRKAFRKRATEGYERLLESIPPFDRDRVTARLAEARSAGSVSSKGATPLPYDEELLVNPNSEEPELENGIAGWTTGHGNWHTGQPKTPPYRGRGYFSASHPDGLRVVELYQEVDITAFVADVRRGKVRASLSAMVHAYDQAPGDKPSILLIALDEDGDELRAIYDSGEVDCRGVWVRLEDEVDVPDGTRTLRFLLRSRREKRGRQTSNDGHFDDLSLKLLR